MNQKSVLGARLASPLNSALYLKIETEEELELFAFSVGYFNGLFCLRKPDV
jgi:hypothetical protein